MLIFRIWLHAILIFITAEPRTLKPALVEHFPTTVDKTRGQWRKQCAKHSRTRLDLLQCGQTSNQHRVNLPAQHQLELQAHPCPRRVQYPGLASPQGWAPSAGPPRVAGALPRSATRCFPHEEEPDRGLSFPRDRLVSPGFCPLPCGTPRSLQG
uniref:Secreted protein n=1 Tax=Ixodes ricinus TaxID=34613 RepID=A0A6B0UXB4_IXORI